MTSFNSPEMGNPEARKIELLGRVKAGWYKIQEMLSQRDYTPNELNQFVRESSPNFEQAFKSLLSDEYELLKEIYKSQGTINTSVEELSGADYFLGRAVFGENLKNNAPDYSGASNKLLQLQTLARDYWNVVAKTTTDFDRLAPEKKGRTKGQSQLEKRATDMEIGRNMLKELLEFAKNYQN